MEYILIIEHETASESTCNIMNLPGLLRSNLESYLKTQNITFNNHKNYFEVDTAGIVVINILCKPGYNYKVVSQSMAIESTTIGGGTVKIQKTVWTLGKMSIY